MKKFIIAILTFYLPAISAQELGFAELSEERLAQVTRQADPELQNVEPFQAFDNLYFVGINWVSAWAVDVGSSIVLIDALYGAHIPRIEENFRILGLNPEDVSHVIVTHAHYDHIGGAKYWQDQYGAQVVLTEDSMNLAQIERSRPISHPYFYEMPTGNIIVSDEIMEIGSNSFEFIETPGHAIGTLSIKFDVMDGNRTYKALTVGGLGVPYPWQGMATQYIESVDKLLELQFDVSISNHPSPNGRLFQEANQLKFREENELHPMLGSENLRSYLRSAREQALEQLQ